jgi:hypothetical protein
VIRDLDVVERMLGEDIFMEGQMGLTCPLPALHVVLTPLHKAPFLASISLLSR